MISTFNLKKLNSLLKDFYTLTQIRITVFDETAQELAAYPPYVAPFCQMIQNDKVAKKKCEECNIRACEIATKQRHAYTYRCHAGLTESITPLYLGNILIGYLVFGNVFSYNTHEEGWAEIKELCKDINVNFADLKKSCWERPLIHENYISSASHILEMVASHLCLEHIVILKQKTLTAQIDEYITEHYTEDINASSICAHFSISRTQLYEITKQCYTVGIAKHIRNLRINKAKQLLIEKPQMRINEIANACGFYDYNYFTTIFKRVTGTSPKIYRISNSKSFE